LVVVAHCGFPAAAQAQLDDVRAQPPGARVVAGRWRPGLELARSVQELVQTLPPRQAFLVVPVAHGVRWWAQMVQAH